MNEAIPELIARAQAGEQEAFRMLVEQHSRSVFNVAYRIVGNPADAVAVRLHHELLRLRRALLRSSGRSAP